MAKRAKTWYHAGIEVGERNERVIHEFADFFETRGDAIKGLKLLAARFGYTNPVVKYCYAHESQTEKRR